MKFPHILGPQILEHAPKALIGAQGSVSRLPDWPSLAETAQISHPRLGFTERVRGRRALRYAALFHSNFGSRAHVITFDMTKIFRRIERLTGTDP